MHIMPVDKMILFAENIFFNMSWFYFLAEAKV